ncbi:MAG: hypothetical protein DUD39_16295 [Coriobacteriaceae bacterium]|nr:MAG: hypothetical protein DUD39_16295 [Coriobacteriaceae bacterium]
MSSLFGDCDPSLAAGLWLARLLHHFTDATLFVVSAEAKFALDGYKTYLSFTIDCFNGWLVCWKVSMHPDCELPVGMLEDLVGKIKALRGKAPRRAYGR